MPFLHRFCAALRRSSSPLFVAAASHGRAARGRHAGSVDRRHHRVPARQRADGAAVPRCVEADDDRQRDRTWSARARELRRDRHGAPARAPGVQGHADARQHHAPSSASAACSFNGTTSWDRTNYFESFTASDENLDWALSMEADRMVNSLHPHERPRLRDDRRAQRVRERREQSAARAVRQDARRPRIEWHNYGTSPIGARSDIENVNIERLQAFYKHVLPARQRRADRRRQVRRRCRRSRSIAKYFGPIPKPTRKLPPHLHRGAGAGRRAHGDAAPRRQLASSSG